MWTKTTIQQENEDAGERIVTNQTDSIEEALNHNSMIENVKGDSRNKEQNRERGWYGPWMEVTRSKRAYKGKGPAYGNSNKNVDAINRFIVLDGDFGDRDNEAAERINLGLTW